MAGSIEDTMMALSDSILALSDSIALLSVEGPHSEVSHDETEDEDEFFDAVDAGEVELVEDMPPSSRPPGAKNTTQSSGSLSEPGSRPPLFTAEKHAHFASQAAIDAGDSKDQVKINSLPAGGQATVSANPQATLLTLPQEIQDIIFDFAYPRVPGIKHLTRHTWEGRERNRRLENGAAYIRLPFPRPKVDSFLVSKKFFVNAARVYIDNQVFDEIGLVVGYNTGIVITDIKCWRKSEYSGIAAAFVSSFKCDYKWLEECVVHLPNLKAITVEVSGWDFRSIFPKIPWEVELEDMDLSSSMADAKLEELRGLHQVHVIGAESRYIKTEAQKAIWTENIQRLEAFLTKYLCRPKKDVNVTRSNVGKPPRLYEGSRVTFESSISQVDRKGAIKERTKGAIKERTKDAIKERSKDATKESNKDAIKESSKDAIKENNKVEDSNKVAIKESNKVVINESSKDAIKESNRDETDKSSGSNANPESFQGFMSAPMLPSGGKRKLGTESATPNEASSLHSSSPGLQSKSSPAGDLEEFEPTLTSSKKRKVLLQDHDIPYDLDHFKALLERDGEGVIEWINRLRGAAAGLHNHNGSVKYAMNAGSVEGAVMLTRLAKLTGMNTEWCKAFLDRAEWNLSTAFNRFENVKTTLPAAAFQQDTQEGVEVVD